MPVAGASCLRTVFDIEHHDPASQNGQATHHHVRAIEEARVDKQWHEFDQSRQRQSRAKYGQPTLAALPERMRQPHQQCCAGWWEGLAGPGE
jgi:hypothetical protein